MISGHEHDDRSVRDARMMHIYIYIYDDHLLLDGDGHVVTSPGQPS